MNIVELKIGDLQPYENNPRKNDKAVDKVAESIKQFGFKVPIVIDSNNVIIAGHTRYKAAKKLKLKEVPCIVATDLTEEQIKAFRLADNKVSEFSEWDFDALEKELDALGDFNMDDFGFDLSLDDDEEDEEIEPAEANFNYQEQYGVIVMCKNEQEQQQAYETLLEMGYECKVVAT